MKKVATGLAPDVAAMSSSPKDKQKKNKGELYVEYLMKHPNKEIPYFYLELVASQQLTIDNGELSDIEIIDNAIKYFIDSEILMCDKQTLREVKTRIKKVKERIETARHALQLQDELICLETEKRCLVSYIAEVVHFKGGIKYFNTEIMKSKEAVMKAINRYLKCKMEKVKSKMIVSRYTIMYSV